MLALVREPVISPSISNGAPPAGHGLVVGFACARGGLRCSSASLPAKNRPPPVRAICLNRSMGSLGRRHRSALAPCFEPLFGCSLGAVLLAIRKRRGLVLPGTRRQALVDNSAVSAAIEEALGSETPAALKQRQGQLRPLIVAMGTRGDVEPCLSIAEELRARGHAPLVLSLDSYQAEVAGRRGLDFRSCGLAGVPLSEAYLTGQTRADQVYADRGWFGDAWVNVGRSINAAVTEHRCNLILSTSMGNTHSLDVAEACGLLCVALKFCPDIDGQVPTSAFAPSGYPIGMPGTLNMAAHTLENLRTVGAVFLGGFIPRVIDFRKELGLPSQKLGDAEVPVYSTYRQILQANQPCIYAFSEALAARPPEYQPWHFVSGAIRQPAKGQAAQEPVPSGLSAFLEAEEHEPVCVAFGSMTLARSAPFQARAVAAARSLGRRVLVVDPDSKEEGPSESDPGVYFIRSAPYAAVFPRCGLVVHHGGAGTAQDCLWAGVPQVIAPVLRWSDQPFWAAALQERGLGVAVGEGGTSPEAEVWERALKEALGQSKDFADAARRAAARASGEHGAEAACDILEGVFYNGGGMESP
mmetsp:Transcript_99096/g.289109  ORF Transcript_99096/g.289109 Transcript_99096/m.289109 type:complete len:583 (+) Transcript_99096:123-1871(+)